MHSLESNQEPPPYESGKLTKAPECNKIIQASVEKLLQSKIIMSLLIPIFSSRLLF
jgi:hypothetical protein